MRLVWFPVFFFSHNVPAFVTGISMQSFRDSNNRNACSFCLHGVTNCRTLSTRPLGHSGRPPEAFGGLTLPTGVIKLVDQSLKSIETWSVVLLFLKMSPNPAVTFLSTSCFNRS